MTRQACGCDGKRQGEGVIPRAPLAREPSLVESRGGRVARLGLAPAMPLSKPIPGSSGEVPDDAALRLSRRMPPRACCTCPGFWPSAEARQDPRRAAAELREELQARHGPLPVPPPGHRSRGGGEDCVRILDRRRDRGETRPAPAGRRPRREMEPGLRPEGHDRQRPGISQGSADQHGMRRPRCIQIVRRRRPDRASTKAGSSSTGISIFRATPRGVLANCWPAGGRRAAGFEYGAKALVSAGRTGLSCASLQAERC